VTRILAIDIEGDGQNPSHPVQLAIRELDDFRLTPITHEWTGRPPGAISKYATRVHNITDASIAHLPPFRDFLPEIARVLQSAPILGHGVRGDFKSLHRLLPDWMPTHGYDTLSMAKQLKPDLPSFKLTGIGDALGLNDVALGLHPGGAHTAIFDATLAGLVAERLLRDLAPKRRDRSIDESNIFRNNVQQPRKRNSRLDHSPS
jgi:DNA polymerase III epsilon subunit-like protein